MSQDDYEEKYTDPDLRRRLKAEIQASDKGGKPGQWSARKSQLLVREYEAAGGGYRKSTKDEAAQALEAWSEQDWQTEDGGDRARTGEVTKRYLPRAVWEKLTDREKQEAEQVKKAASQQGNQHGEWPPAVKRAMQEYEAEFESEHAPEPEPESKAELYKQAKALNISGRSKMNRQELAAAIQAARKGDR